MLISIPSTRTYEFEVINKSKVVAYFGIHIINDIASLHLEVLHWSASTCKMLIKDWEVIKRYIKILGCSRVVVSTPNNNDIRWPKLIKLFGFPKPEVITLSTLEVVKWE